MSFYREELYYYNRNKSESQTQKISLSILVPGEVDDDESETTQRRGERPSSIEKRACRIQRRY
jgi:hypothetical protein